MRTFEATIWEKAEHWTFYVNVKAVDETEARALLIKQYPVKHYTIRDIR